MVGKLKEKHKTL